MSRNDTKIVYVAAVGWWDSYSVVGVFTDEDKAQTEANKALPSPGWYIEILAMELQ